MMPAGAQSPCDPRKEELHFSRPLLDILFQVVLHLTPLEYLCFLLSALVASLQPS